MVNLVSLLSQLLPANESAPSCRVQRTDSVSVQSLVSTPLWRDGMDLIESMVHRHYDHGYLLLCVCKVTLSCLEKEESIR